MVYEINFVSLYIFNRLLTSISKHLLVFFWPKFFLYKNIFWQNFNILSKPYFFKTINKKLILLVEGSRFFSQAKFPKYNQLNFNRLIHKNINFYPNILTLIFPIITMSFGIKIHENRILKDYLLTTFMFSRKTAHILNMKKFLNRWINGYFFLMNVFFYNWNFLTLGIIEFKKETLGLNWYFSNINLILWRYSFPFFIFKLNHYSPDVQYFFHRLNKLGANIAFVMDLRFHYRNLLYLKRTNFFTVGLIDYTTKPWMVHFGLIVPKSNYFFVSFFYMLIIYFQKYTAVIKNNMYLNLWFFFFFKNIVK